MKIYVLQKDTVCEMKREKAKQISDFAVTISVLLYVVACFLPTGVSFGADPSKGLRGIMCLLMGWFGAFGEYTVLHGGWGQMLGDKWQFLLTSLVTAPATLGAWLSNLLYFRAIVDLFRERKARRSLILCAIAFASALAFLLIYYPLRFKWYPQVGCYFWLASYLMALIGAIAFWISKKGQEEQTVITPIHEEKQNEPSTIIPHEEEQQTTIMVQEKKTKKKMNKWLTASLIFFSLACISPMVAHNYGEYGAPGFMCIVLGWMGVLGSFNMMLIWFTSFFYYAGLWFASKKPTPSPAPVVMTMLSFLTTVIILIATFMTQISYHEEVLHIGYYFWIAANFTLCVNTMRRWWNTKG